MAVKVPILLVHNSSNSANIIVLDYTGNNKRTVLDMSSYNGKIEGEYFRLYFFIFHIMYLSESVTTPSSNIAIQSLLCIICWSGGNVVGWNRISRASHKIRIIK